MTANERYRAYKKEGGFLSFADYMTREKTKGFLNFDGSVDVPTNKPLSDSINNVLTQMHAEAGEKQNVEGRYVLGINKNVLIVSGIVAAVAISIVLIHHSNH